MPTVLGALAALLLNTSAISAKGAIATAHPLASEAGAAVLRAGGNAADAAVAAAFAVGVLEPQSSGIGGGGFALVYLAKEERVHVLDFREVAPAAATPTMFVKDGQPRPELSLTGPLSVAVPGAVRGYAELARRFGKKPLRALTAPAERLAGGGVPVSRSFLWAAQERFEMLKADPEASRTFLFRGADGAIRPPRPGDRLVQKDLAATLRAIGRQGADAFYRGPIARKMVDAVRSRGGILTAEDLSGYAVRDRQPLHGHYRGHRVVTMPLPSAGGAILLGLLHALEPEDPRAGGYRPERFLHVMVEAEKRLFARRAALLGDPAHVPGADAAAREMTTPAFASALRAQIGERATPSTQIAIPREQPNTTHISVVDGEGNAVALTTTVNYLFGSGIVAPGTGVLLNDEMDDFDIAPGVPNAYGLRGSDKNAPAPGKTPLSSMSPTIVFDVEGRVRWVLGAPGGSTIPTTVAQAIVNLVDNGMAIDQALAAPRIHHQLFPDAVRVEPNGLDAATVQALGARGHTVRFSERHWGNAQGVAVLPESGWREAASDPRYDGAPAAQ
jgi:gamma-glutamyltranspeptidase/glutathione hydrolase